MSGILNREYKVDTAVNRGINYFSWLSLLDTNVIVIITLLTIVAAVTLIGGVLIIILDKTRLIGQLKTMGMPNSKIRQLFIYMALRIAVYGMLAGNAIMLIALWLQHRYRLIPLDPEAYYIDFVPVEISWLAVIILNVGALAVLTPVLLIPASYAARLNPASTVS